MKKQKEIFDLTFLAFWLDILAEWLYLDANRFTHYIMVIKTLKRSFSYSYV